MAAHGGAGHWTKTGGGRAAGAGRGSAPPPETRAEGQIEALEKRYEAALERNIQRSRDLNPAADTGGLRNVSARARDRADARILAEAERIGEMRNRINSMRAELAAYRSASREQTTVSAMLARGQTIRGERLSPSDIKGLRKRGRANERIISDFEIKYQR